eukprot:scaffold114827_cov72-Phaeocystis_antarctica.AAC.1
MYVVAVTSRSRPRPRTPRRRGPPLPPLRFPRPRRREHHPRQRRRGARPERSAAPEWSKAVESGPLEAARSTREAVAGRSVNRPLSESAKLPRAARRALRRHRSRAEALPRLQLDHAAARARRRPCPSGGGPRW